MQICVLWLKVRVTEGAGDGRGHVFTVMNRHEDAFAAYDKALSPNPDLAMAEDARLHAKMRCCDWSHDPLDGLPA